jgi:hypothetical protein
MRSIAIGGALFVASALTAASPSSASAQQRQQSAAPRRETDFSGRWSFVSRDSSSETRRAGAQDPLGTDAEDEGGGRRVRQEMVVTQSAESLTVRRRLMDSAGRVVRTLSATYRFRGGEEWSGPYAVQPGAVATTSARWMENGRALELTTVARWRRRDGSSGERQVATTESWRLRADGTLRRRLNEVTAAGTRSATETWRRAEQR